MYKQLLNQKGEPCMKKLLATILTIALVLSLSACGGPSNTSSPAASGTEGGSGSSGASDFTPVTWRFANQHAPDQPGCILDQRICDEITEATQGRVTVELYANNALGDYTSVFDELMLGTIEMAHITPVESYDSRVSAAMIPYLGTTYDELLKAYARDGYLFGQVKEALGAIGIELMGICPEGYNGIGTMTELQTPAAPGVDKGIVIRTPMLDIFALSGIDLGFRVSSMPYADTYTAMQTGVVGGWAGGSITGNYFVMRDLIRYFYDYRQNQEATLIMVSSQAWNQLLPEDQEAISQIVAKGCEDMAEITQKADAENIPKLEEAGIKVIQFSDEELRAFADSCHQNVWPKLSANYPEGFIDNILADISK